jgi:hypothetical protein
MSWKYLAEKRGKEVGERIENMKWHTFSNNGVFSEKDRPNANSKTFLADRQEKINEENLLDTIFPFVAYFTAPTKLDKEDVISKIFKEEAKKNERLMMMVGFDPRNVTLKARLKSKEKFFDSFKIVADQIEKSCVKIMKNAN